MDPSVEPRPMMDGRGYSLLCVCGEVHLLPEGWTMAKRNSQRVWMRVLGKDDAVRLGDLPAKKRPAWSEWECKAHRGNVIVYAPVTPWNPKTRRLDPSMRYLDKQWRVVPEPGGPFQLEYMRHTGQWWPILEAVGDLEQMVTFIERDARRLGYIDPTDT